MSEKMSGPFVAHVDTDEGWRHDEETGGLVLMLRDDPVSVGLWKPPDGRVEHVVEYDLEADETLLVIAGAGELRVDDGAPIELRPGVVVALSRGVRLHWRVDADFRELWVYS
jgi:uncharacterized cupin superfamily protein